LQRFPLAGLRKPAAVLGRRKMAKHFELTITTITDSSFGFVRNTAAIAREAALDGFYVLRTNVPTSTLGSSAPTSDQYQSQPQQNTDPMQWAAKLW
jgi:hypothetical protein